MPADADWDPADMRHKVVRWMSSAGTGYAGAFAQATLRGLAAKIGTSEKRAHDPVTAAHLTETRVRIAHFLYAQAIA